MTPKQTTDFQDAFAYIRKYALDKFEDHCQDIASKNVKDQNK